MTVARGMTRFNKNRDLMNAKRTQLHQGLLAEVRAYRRADMDDDAFAAILLRRVTTHLYFYNNNSQ